MNHERAARIEELLAGWVLGDLSADELSELSAFQAEGIDLAPDKLERVLSEALAALTGLSDPEPLPDSLRSRLEADAPGWAQTRGDIPAPAPDGRPNLVASPGGPGAPRGPRWFAWSGWAAAALFCALWLGSSSGDTTPVPERQLDISEILDALVREQHLELDWTATEDPAAAQASGTIVWSNSRQAGVMRFQGLAANDPGEFRYQLWIFDAARDERYPVDGGLFDVPAGETEVFVPIDARLQIGNPTLFAVTVERPDGVVVSDRERIVVLAQTVDASQAGQ